MSEERNRILNMISKGQISAEEGARLLDAMQHAAAPTTPPPSTQGVGRANWFHVRVTDLETGRAKVNVNLPLGLVKAGLKVGAHYAPEMEGLDWDDLLVAIQEGASGKLVDVEDLEDGEKVEIFIG
jgi:hypothetical protein